MELRTPEEPLPPHRWVRVVAGVIGALIGGAVGASVEVLTCDELGCVVVGPGGFVLGAVLGGLIAFTATLDLQRWRARRWAEHQTERRAT